jgi:hypothetical protein
MGKISTYLENLSLNVKILDDGMVGEMKSLVGNGVAETQGDVASGKFTVVDPEITSEHP